ncbi:MAG: hypothetical protein EOO28_13430 [Comamonadaceae bacterium]|nr:MAG: hypothetical protein EOO28_13430 [Comamonadaceae bacterium]
MFKPSSFIHKVLFDKREELVIARAAAIKPYDDQIAELDRVLFPVAELTTKTSLPQSTGVLGFIEDEPALMIRPTIPPAVGEVETFSARLVNRNALVHAKRILSTKFPLKTPELYKLVEDSGVKLKAADPEGRFAQLLSASDDFVSDRRLGWSLKGESPSGLQTDGLSSATKSDDDEL